MNAFIDNFAPALSALFALAVLVLLGAAISLVFDLGRLVRAKVTRDAALGAVYRRDAQLRVEQMEEASERAKLVEQQARKAGVEANSTHLTYLSTLESKGIITQDAVAHYCDMEAMADYESPKTIERRKAREEKQRRTFAQPSAANPLGYSLADRVTAVLNDERDGSGFTDEEVAAILQKLGRGDHRAGAGPTDAQLQASMGDLTTSGRSSTDCHFEARFGAQN